MEVRPWKNFFEISVAKSRILMHFASTITESVSLKVFYFGLLIMLVNNVMSCFYLIFDQLICFLNFTLS